MGRVASDARRIPVFALYGEAAAAAVPGFVHVERIAERAPLHGWTIGPHRHTDLAQAILVTEGEGRIVADETRQEIRAPWLLWLPVGAVHGLSFSGTADGHVLTIADTLLAAAVHGAPDEIALRGAAEAVHAGPAPRPEVIDINLDVLLAAASREARSNDAGSASAVAAFLRLLLVALLRARRAARPGTEKARDASLSRRFRSLIETRFREHWPVSRYAVELGVSVDLLHEACATAIGRPPRDVLHDRLMLEARRDLLYTALPISRIALSLGFDDPAYFSRFFAKRAAMSAAAYRRAHAKAVDRSG
jgi:AraC family transcriptional activator of pobA